MPPGCWGPDQESASAHLVGVVHTHTHTHTHTHRHQPPVALRGISQPVTPWRRRPVPGTSSRASDGVKVRTPVPGSYSLCRRGQILQVRGGEVRLLRASGTPPPPPQLEEGHKRSRFSWPTWHLSHQLVYDTPCSKCPVMLVDLLWDVLKC